MQVPERHQQQTGRARLAPQQSQEVHRRQEPRPSLRTGRTGVSEFAMCIHYLAKFCSALNPSQHCPLCVLHQSFCASLHQELKEYYRLLSVLHSQVGRANGARKMNGYRDE